MPDRLRCYFLPAFSFFRSFCWSVFVFASGAELEAAANVPKLIKIEINIGPLAKSIKQSQHARSGLSMPFHSTSNAPRGRHEISKMCQSVAKAKVPNSLEPKTGLDWTGLAK